MKPYDINTVADYVIQRLNLDEKVDLVNLKLQKLLYYVQAWSLGITEEPFMNCSFEAWVHGPVCRALYDRFKMDKSLYSFITPSDMINANPQDCIEEEDRGFIDYILENYAGFSGTELETMTHRETPWAEARKGLEPLEKGNKEISNESMRSFYGEKWEKISSK